MMDPDWGDFLMRGRQFSGLIESGQSDCRLLHSGDAALMARRASISELIDDFKFKYKYAGFGV